MKRFWDKVNKTAKCWNWTAAKDKNGYGKFWLNKTMTTAHRASYELNVGHIPESMTLDHLCKNRACVNPSHLEAVPHEINLARSSNTLSTINSNKTQCPKGHAYSESNTRIIKLDNGREQRKCKICSAFNYKIWYNKQNKEN